jgi:(p)ppGpp synthase/HD superfamily hydrolase
MGPNGVPLQLHIRTLAMDEVAENGIITHWLTHQHDSAFLSAHNRTNSWINNILDIQSSTFSANEFLDSLKQDLSPGDIYVFTPKGKIKLLPKESTVLDFAYFIHSDIGNRCYMARVNQKLEKPSYTLKNGDIVEIITRETIEPKEEWLKIAVSGKARSKIKQYFKEQKFDEDVSNGIHLLNLGLSIFKPIDNVDDDMLKKLIEEYYPKLDIKELKHRVGSGQLAVLEIIKKILGYSLNAPLELNLSQCKMPVIQDEHCLALPGDKILCRITRQGQLLIHRSSCKPARSGGLDNLTYVLIINDMERRFASKIQVLISNEPGTFAKLSGVIGEKRINIIELTQASYTEEIAAISAKLGVKSLSEAEDLIRLLREKEFIQKAILL